MPSFMPMHSEERCAQHALAMAGTTAGVSPSLNRRERNTNLPVLQYFHSSHAVQLPPLHPLTPKLLDPNL